MIGRVVLWGGRRRDRQFGSRLDLRLARGEHACASFDNAMRRTAAIARMSAREIHDLARRVQA